MGCLQLRYQTTETPLKVAYRKPSSSENIAQGFLSVDPIAEDYPQLSSYNYAGNKPITHVDIDGLQSDGGDDKKNAGVSQQPPEQRSIAKGDTFWNIENQLDMTHGTLQQYNPTLDAKNLKIGSQINVGDPSAYNNFRDMTISEFTGMDGDQGDFIMIFDNSGELKEAYTDRMASDQQLNDLMGFTVLNALIPMRLEAGLVSPKIPMRTIQKFDPSFRPRTVTADDFISPHAFNKHKYDPTKVSTRSQTQYGETINPAEIRNQTLNSPDKVVSHLNEEGIKYATTYKKTFSYNISTNATMTRESRVIVNHLNPQMSSQFPYFKKGITDGF